MKLDKASAFPFFLSFSVFCCLSGLVVGLTSISWNILLLGLLGVVICLWGWWISLTKEFLLGSVPSMIKSAYRFGFGLFIISEVMFFVSFFWAFFCFSVLPSPILGGEWPPVGVVCIPAFGIPLLNTIILLSSGVSISWAHSSVKHFFTFTHRLDKRFIGPSLFPLLITLMLGAYFLVIQLVEYSEAPFSISDGVFGTSFFMLTGLHGLHVFLGCLFLFFCSIRFSSFSKKSHVGFECAIWYWHFVDVVWLFLFGFVYVWSSGF